MIAEVTSIAAAVHDDILLVVANEFRTTLWLRIPRMVPVLETPSSAVLFYICILHLEVEAK